MEPVQLAAVLAGAMLVASLVSVEAGISVALVELTLGVVLGNTFDLDPNASWLAFIASFASVVLTFLAGAEVDPDDFRERFWASISIGVVSFLGPFATATLLTSGKALVTGGYDIDGNPLSSAELYDPTSGTFRPWESPQAMEAALQKGWKQRRRNS